MVNASILIASEITQEIAKGRLVTGAVNGRVRGCSLDLTVGTVFWEGKIIKPRPDGSPEQVTVPPGGVVGIFTAEELNLPNEICATAFAINALSSKGFLVVNPGHIDPGFEGPLSVKALNIRKSPIVIQHGEPIFTVIFQRLGQAAPAFGGNKSKSERERKFNATIVETSPRTLSDIIEADTDGPFLGRQAVEDLLRTHWMSRWTLTLTVFAVVLSLVAAIASIAQLRHARQEVMRDGGGHVSYLSPSSDVAPADKVEPISHMPDQGSSEDVQSDIPIPHKDVAGEG